MGVKQVSVFVENKEGRIAKITSLLAENRINIRTLTVADTTNFGILRLITAEPERAVEVLRGAGYTASLTEVIAIEVPDVPGGLASALNILGSGEVSVEYIYSYMSPSDGKAILIVRTDNEKAAAEVLVKNGYTVVDGEQLY